MPLVRIYVGNDIKDGELDGVQNLDKLIGDLLIASREIVPAGMNSKMGPLAPGSIEFLPHVVARKGMTVDVFVEIEAYKLKDRKNIDKRAKKIKCAFSQLFPDQTFAIWLKLVTAGWASDSTDAKFDGDMSMKAAVQRALMNLRGAFNFVNPEDDTPENREIVRLLDERQQSSYGELTLEEAAAELGYCDFPLIVQIKRSD